MKVVIAGASGLIGRHVSNWLCERGVRVIGLTRSLPIPTSDKSNFEWVNWLGKDTHWTKSIEGADAVINFSGKPILARWTEKYKEELLLSRVQPTMHLSNAIKHAKTPPKCFINASAIGFYQSDTVRHDCTEDSEIGNGFIANLCNDWEVAAQNAKSANTRVVRLRIGMVLSNDGAAFPPMLMSMKAFSGGPGFGNGEQGFPWIHIDDIAGMLEWIINSSDIEGPINAVAPNTGSLADFSADLGQYLGRPSWFKLPKFIYDIALGKGLSGLMFTSPFVSPKVAIEKGYVFRHPTTESAFKSLIGN